MSALWSQSGQSAEGIVLVLLLHAGSARALSEHEQVCQARSGQWQRAGAFAVHADSRPTRFAGKSCRPGRARLPAADSLASVGCADGRRKVATGVSAVPWVL